MANRIRQQQIILTSIIAKYINWVKKYNLHGYDGLKDGRGKGKPQSVLTPEEALKAEIKILKEKNKFLQMENDVLKKEEEIERKLMKQASDKKHHTKR